MKTWKQIAAVVLACTMVLPAFACSHGTSEGGDTADSSSSADSNGSADNSGNADGSSADGNENSNSGGDVNVSTNDDNMFVVDLNFVDDISNSDIGVSEDADADAENFIVTTIRGDDGQIYVPQTDINGTTVTNSSGETVTEVYTGTTLATTYAEPTYTPAYKNYQAFWLDMSKQEDFVFDGELLVYEIEIAEDAVDGVYPIQFYFADIANWDAQTVKDVTMNVGYVCVNSEEPENDQPTGSGLTINPGTVSGKQGDTVRFAVNVANNPGFVGFRLRMRYDSNAMTIVDAGAGADLHSAASMSAREIGENS